MKRVRIYMVVLGVAALFVRCDDAREAIPEHRLPPAFAIVDRDEQQQDEHPYYMDGNELYRFSAGYIGRESRNSSWGILWQRMLIAQDVYNDGIYWHLIISPSEIDTQDSVLLSQMTMNQEWRWISSTLAATKTGDILPGGEYAAGLPNNLRAKNPYQFRILMPPNRIGSLYQVMDNFNAVARHGGKADSTVLIYPNKLRKAFYAPVISWLTSEQISASSNDYGYAAFNGEDYQYLRHHWVFDDYADKNYK